MGPERKWTGTWDGFWMNPSGRSARNLSQYTMTLPPSNETSQRVIELETALESMWEQLAQSDAMHKEQLE